MRERQPRQFDHAGALAWVGTVVLALVGIALIGLWLTTRAIGPAAPSDGLEDAAEAVVGAAGLLCVLAVGIGASLLRARTPARRPHRMAPDPARHGAHVRSTLTATPRHL